MNVQFSVVPGSNEHKLALAQNVLIAAQCQGLSLCDLLQKMRGIDEGRKIAQQMGHDIATYPIALIDEIRQFKLH
jgi:hypothetical protein